MSHRNFGNLEFIYKQINVYEHTRGTGMATKASNEPSRICSVEMNGLGDALSERNDKLMPKLQLKLR